MMKILLLIFLNVFYYSLCTRAQLRSPSKSDSKFKLLIDSAVSKAAAIYLQDSGTHSISIGVYFKGRKFTYTYGDSKKDFAEMGANTNFFNIGSVAKPFVSTMLARAVVENKVKLTDDIRKYLPGEYPNLMYEGHPIALINLANHTSALPGTFHVFPNAVSDSVRHLKITEQIHFYSLYTADSLLSDLHSVKPDTIPGSKFRYNSAGYTLLVLILEKLYKKSYQQLLTNYLQHNLGMFATTPVLTNKQMKLTAQGYDNKNQPQPYSNLIGYYIGPSLNSTINDMLIFIMANVAEADVAVKLTHKRTWEQSGEISIGLGWMSEMTNGKKYFYHDGNTKIGFNSYCSFSTVDKAGLIVMANDNTSLEKLTTVGTQIRTVLAGQEK